MDYIIETLKNLAGKTAFANIGFGNVFMILVACGFLYLAIKKDPKTIAIKYAAKIPICAAAPSRKLLGLAIRGPKSVIAVDNKRRT